MWTTAVTVAGAATMVVGAYRSVQETDLKRILAYSTLSALGVLTMLLGVGTREAIIAALVYLVAHAGYKGALFLVAGAIDHETGTRDISALAGLRRAMPLTALAGGAAALSMAGVPLTLGFVGKDAAYEGLLHATDWYPWLLVLMVLASVLLGLSGLIAGVLPFRGDPARVKEVHDPAWPLWIPPLLLAAGGLFVGVAPSILNGPLSTAATAIAGMSVDVSLSVWHGITPTLLLSLFTLAAVGSSYVVHEAVRARTWKPRHGTEDLYKGALSGLNAVSRAIAPALHSASLRTYVMVIVATSVLVGGAALVTDTGLGSAMPRTSIAPHDVLIVVAHRRRCNCGGLCTIDDVSGPLTRGGRLRRRNDVPQLRRTRPRDDAVLGRDPHRPHLRARLSTFPRTGPAVVTARSCPRRTDCRRDRYLHWRTTRVRRDDRNAPEAAGGTSPSLDRPWGMGETSSTSSWSISGRSTHSAKSRSWQLRHLAFVGCCDSQQPVDRTNTSGSRHHQSSRRRRAC